MYIYHGAGDGLQLPAFASGVKGFGKYREPLSELYHTNAPLLFELEGADFGSVTVAEAGGTEQTIDLPGHREAEVSRLWAASLAARLRCRRLA